MQTFLQHIISQLPKNTPYEIALEISRLKDKDIAQVKTERNINGVILDCTVNGPTMFLFTPDFPCVYYFVSVLTKLTYEECVTVANLYASIFDVEVHIRTNVKNYFDIDKQRTICMVRTPNGRCKLIGDLDAMLQFRNITHYDFEARTRSYFIVICQKTLDEILPKLAKRNIRVI